MRLSFGLRALLGSTSLLVLGLTSVTASALPLSDYNLILSGDYNFTGGEVEGRTLIGGNLNASGQAPVFGTRLNSSPDIDSLTVAGDAAAQHIHLNGGSMVYGGNLNASVNKNGGGTVTRQSGLDFSGVFQALETGSLGYAGMSGNGAFVGDLLEYTGTDSTAVFNVSAADIFAQNTALKLNAGSAETVIVNVSGSDIHIGGGVNLTNGFDVEGHGGVGARNILWNFHEALNINLDGLGSPKGSILAPFADVIGGNGQYDGSLAAKSYKGAREFHDYPFIPPTTTVPEPGTLALLILGLGLVSLRRRLLA